MSAATLAKKLRSSVDWGPTASTRLVPTKYMNQDGKRYHSPRIAVRVDLMPGGSADFTLPITATWGDLADKIGERAHAAGATSVSWDEGHVEWESHRGQGKPGCWHVHQMINVKRTQTGRREEEHEVRVVRLKKSTRKKATAAQTKAARAARTSGAVRRVSRSTPSRSYFSMSKVQLQADGSAGAKKELARRKKK